eukprot:scpid99898/ scgid19709/ 
MASAECSGYSTYRVFSAAESRAKGLISLRMPETRSNVTARQRWWHTHLARTAMLVPGTLTSSIVYLYYQLTSRCLPSTNDSVPFDEGLFQISKFLPPAPLGKAVFKGK